MPEPWAVKRDFDLDRGALLVVAGLSAGLSGATD